MLLLIVLLWKCHSRDGEKTFFTINSETLEKVEPIYEAIPDSMPMITREVIHSQHNGPTAMRLTTKEYIETYRYETVVIATTQHIETHSNGAYETTATGDPIENITAHGNEAYQNSVTTNSTEHIEIHGNEAYQTTATINPTEHIKVTGYCCGCAKWLFLTWCY